MLSNQEIEIQNIDHLGIVADCALYTETNIKLMSDLRWLCRVPFSNWNEHRDFILNLLPDDCLRYYQLNT